LAGDIQVLEEGYGYEDDDDEEKNEDGDDNLVTGEALDPLKVIGLSQNIPK
jgi:hypothetical protein